jgi:hypothetical protein
MQLTGGMEAEEEHPGWRRAKMLRRREWSWGYSL